MFIELLTQAAYFLRAGAILYRAAIVTLGRHLGPRGYYTRHPAKMKSTKIKPEQ